MISIFIWGYIYIDEDGGTTSRKIQNPSPSRDIQNLKLGGPEIQDRILDPQNGDPNPGLFSPDPEPDPFPDPDPIPEPEPFPYPDPDPGPILDQLPSPRILDSFQGPKTPDPDPNPNPGIDVWDSDQ